MNKMAYKLSVSINGLNFWDNLLKDILFPSLSELLVSKRERLWPPSTKATSSKLRPQRTLIVSLKYSIV